MGTSPILAPTRSRLFLLWLSSWWWPPWPWRPPSTLAPTPLGLFPMPDGQLPMPLGPCPMLAGPRPTPENHLLAQTYQPHLSYNPKIVLIQNHKLEDFLVDRLVAVDMVEVAVDIAWEVLVVEQVQGGYFHLH